MDGSAYNHLIPAVPGSNETVKKYADLADTVRFIPKAVHMTRNQTAKLVPVLKGQTLRQTCSNIWHFLYGHIRYQKDEEGKEQIRSPARSWRDRGTGIDCDCFSVFVSSILTNMGIPHLLRITKYPHSRGSFSHIYPVVPHGTGYITMDCVTDSFDYEVPYTEKKDFNMELQFLNGFDNGTGAGGGLEELGRLLQRKGGKVSPFRPKALKKQVRNIQQQRVAGRKSPNVALPDAGGYNTPAPKKKKFGGKLLNIVNKVNPATVLLRNGILASMKLNIRNVAARLRWSYLSPQQAAAKEIEPAKFQKLVAARMRLEKIFFGAGGKPANLRKAIIGGKGNRDRAVSGLEGFEGFTDGIGGMNEYTPMPLLLGSEVYHDENISGMEGFGQLGEPVTLSTIAAAAGVIAGIVGMLKEVGNIFKKKEAAGAGDFDENKNAEADKQAPVPATPPAEPPPTATPPYAAPDTPEPPPFRPAAPAATGPPADTGTGPLPAENRAESPPGNLPATKEDAPKAETGTDTGSGGEPPKEGFWEKNKSWLKPVAIGTGALTLAGLLYAAVKKDRPPVQRGRGRGGYSGLAGPPGRAKNHRRKTRGRFEPKKAIGLSD
jgi:hypothetical protein